MQRVSITASLLNDLKQAHILKIQEEREEKRKGLRKIIKLLKLKVLLKETSWDEQSSPRLRQLALSSFLVILAIANLWDIFDHPILYMV